MPDQFILEQSVEDRVLRVLGRNHAVVGRLVGNVFFPEGGISDEALEVYLKNEYFTTVNFGNFFWIRFILGIEGHGTVYWAVFHVLRRTTVAAGFGE